MLPLAMRLDEWNERYRSREAIDREPAPLLVESAQRLPPGRALDLACGAGRNAIWLARQGWSVTAIDGAEEAIRLVHEADARIDARVLDLERDTPLPFAGGSFDLVAILYFLHRPLFQETERVLRAGGLAVIATRSRGISPRFCASLDDLRAAFAGWDVLRASGGEIAELVVRKPA